MDQDDQKYLIRLENSKQNNNLIAIQQKLSQFSKYYFDVRSNTLLISDRTSLYIVSNDQIRITDLGKIHTISQIAYNPFRHIIIFLTFDGQLYGHFMNYKTQIMIRKNLKAEILFDWIYGRQIIDLFIADKGGVKLIKVDDERKTFKEIKNVSAKYNSFLYDPLSQVLAGFPVGDCKVFYTFNFNDESKAKNWFKGPQIPINFENDQILVNYVKKNKSLGFKNCRIHSQLFTKPSQQICSGQLIRMNNRSYLVIYFSSEGKLKLYPIIQQATDKQISIKLPSDSIPIFHVVDNMLIIHLRNQKITFIYDVCKQGNAQILVTPFPIEHKTHKDVNLYDGSFCGKRHVLQKGIISKWYVNIPVIFHYLRNEELIFQFLLRRRYGKLQLLKWIRENLLSFKQINLSKFWKSIFFKYLHPEQDNFENINLVELYANVFYTLVKDDMVPREQILSIILECVRQANQLQVKIPVELQKIILELLLLTKKYEMLVHLSHNNIIKDSQQFAQILINKGKEENSESLLTLAIDMAHRACTSQKTFEFLMLSQKINEARRFLKHNFDAIEVAFMVYAAKLIQDEDKKKNYVKFTKILINKKIPSSISEKYLEDVEESIQTKEQNNQFLRSSLK